MQGCGRGSSTRTLTTARRIVVVSFAWIALIVSGLLEAVWATALDSSKGFRRLWPTVIFLASYIASMVGLAIGMSEIPVGTAYAVWVGIGAVLTAAWAMITKKDRATVLRVALLAGLIACVVGLKAVS
ncbi:QacE family quaternary ammonium compound efflux SMR transporter [Leucobacter luti]|nr:QacE family quaternary ammonium compound efflux SMR transporter [Leucobacter luti]